MAEQRRGEVDGAKASGRGGNRHEERHGTGWMQGWLLRVAVTRDALAKIKLPPSATESGAYSHHLLER